MFHGGTGCQIDLTMASERRRSLGDSLNGRGLEPSTVISEVRETDDSTLYVAHHDVEEDGLSVTLSLALAAATDSSPTEFLPRFQEYVDPDALDRMFRPQPNGDLRKGGPFHLTVEDIEVEIHNTGRIELRE